MAFSHTAISNFTRIADRFAKLVQLHVAKMSLVARTCATENSSGAGRGLSRFSLSETSASREDPVSQFCNAFYPALNNVRLKHYSTLVSSIANQDVQASLGANYYRVKHCFCFFSLLRSNGHVFSSM